MKKIILALAAASAFWASQVSAGSADVAEWERKLESVYKDKEDFAKNLTYKSSSDNVSYFESKGTVIGVPNRFIIGSWLCAAFCKIQDAMGMPATIATGTTEDANLWNAAS